MKFFLKYSLFISIIATFMHVETAVFLYHQSVTFKFLGFIFFSTLFVYNTYYVSNKQYPLSVWISSASGILGCIFLFVCKSLNYYFFGAVAALSLLYLIPVNINTKAIYSWLRLLLLIIVWFLATTFLEFKSLQIDSFSILFLALRFLLITISCFHFYIKDDQLFKAKSLYQILFFLNAIFTILSLSMLFLNVSYGFAALATTLFVWWTFYYFKSEKRTQNQYLLFADGMLFLLPIFAFITQLISKL